MSLSGPGSGGGGAPGSAGLRSPSSPPADDGGPPSAKRKLNSDSPAGAPRAKRNRYISIACNECKRRKIKCNGETPCQRCGNLGLECVYAPNCCSNGFKDSDEYRQITTHLQSLQDQVNTLYSNMSDLQNKSANGRASVSAIGGLLNDAPQANGSADPQFAFQTPDSRRTSEQQSAPLRTYSAPTGANGFLDQMSHPANGLALDSPGVDGMSHMPAPKPVLNAPSPDGGNGSEPNISIAKDPLWNISLDDALRLCRVFAELHTSTHPVVDIEKVTNKARTMCKFLDSLRRVGLMKKESQRGDSFCDDETLVLKMTLAVAASRDEEPERSLGQSLLDNVRRIINSEDRMTAPATIAGIQLYLLMVLYYLKIGAEVLAYRTVGVAARQCFELGLNRGDVVADSFRTDDARREAVRVFWLTYIFDNRLASETGLPPCIYNHNIDPNLPPIEERHAYARAMIYFRKIAGSIVAPISGMDKGLDLKMESMSWTDWQISQWCAAIPEKLRFTHLDLTAAAEDMPRVRKQLRVELYLRGNQLRLSLYRPVFYSQASSLENRGYAQTAVEIAKDNLRTLTELDKATDIYRTEQLSFHHYLVQSLGVLFMAVAQLPVEFSTMVRDEFYIGADLVKTAARDSVPLQRLARTVAKLKKVAPKFEFMPPSHPGAHPLANPKDMGVAGFHGAWQPSPHAMAPPPAGPFAELGLDLLQLFETACSFGDVFLNKHGAMLMNGMDAGALAGQMETFAGLWRNEQEEDDGSDMDFARAVKDIF